MILCLSIILGIASLLVLLFSIASWQSAVQRKRDNERFREWHFVLTSRSFEILRNAVESFYCTNIPVRWRLIRLIVPKEDEENRLRFESEQSVTGLGSGYALKARLDCYQLSAWETTVSHATFWDGMDLLKSELEKEGIWKQKETEENK